MSTPPIHARPLVGLAALKAAEAAKKASALAVAEPSTKITPPNPLTCKERIGIVFDDSGSMSGQKISDAHAGVEDFLRNCKKDETSISIYPMNQEPLHLSLNLPALALLTKQIRPTGGTPLVSKSKQLLKDEPLTRIIIFSDGEATDNSKAYNAEIEPADELIAEAQFKKIAIDTVYISDPYERAVKPEQLLRKIADKTGGVFLKFEAGKSNFRTAFKYLSPTYRAMLVDNSMVEKIESGVI